MEIKTARRKSFDVEYVVVSEENIEEVRDWCGGAIGGEGADRFIRLIDKNAMNTRQTKAFIGDYVLKAGTSFKSYGKKPFEKSFEPLEGNRAAVNQKMQKVTRSAETGQFVTHQEAEENPDTTVVETVEREAIIAPDPTKES